MAELVYAHDLKSCLERDVGSTPTPGTKLKDLFLFHLFPVAPNATTEIPAKQERDKNKAVCFCPLARDRTSDLLLKRELLYQLSYKGFCYYWCPGEESNLHELLH